MSLCLGCGADAATDELLPSYDDNAIGLPVTLVNGVRAHRCAECGFEGVEILDPRGLEAAAAVARILMPIALRGPEIRFLRKACGLTGVGFAEMLRIDHATLSRWENAAPRDGYPGQVSDRTIREVTWSLLYKRTPAIQVPPAHFLLMQSVRLPDDQPPPRLALERVRLKDAATRTKSDEWDIQDQAA
jgi:transcriptional regulator with XRE-family HTH domain